jgi:hypothetical protein
VVYRIRWVSSRDRQVLIEIPGHLDRLPCAIKLVATEKNGTSETALAISLVPFFW